MSPSRRSFVATAASLTAVAASRGVEPALTTASSALTDAQVVRDDDSLGVRADFSVVRARTFLNSAYITPVPQPVVTAGQAFVESKSLRPLPLGDMLKKTDEVRGQFARLVNAGPHEIGFIFATSEGENVVANALDLGRGDDFEPLVNRRTNSCQLGRTEPMSSTMAALPGLRLTPWRTTPWPSRRRRQVLRSA